ncbi:MAG TPA: RluA family pseudouridine synthase [Treponemataceae bacterium]|jgi:23S rRNA pseudouridine1911/1915/1917 synthase|nr:RluA family pseudouridine synthase [Treponema sp.]OQB04713.1 MAG: Ribosomal large subunit pseudouridine synthase D [Spirochaetes bacterium ADurb.Bin215]HOF84663.1 RluA family pseudouridine synthase [Treponemataceae bacterium]HOS34934.1 RluA family pseudouridine synthase [Treponemataceae bacterium]HOU38900.1 RluA family pseudouridine synthase [Treponemataceae bacterium]
MPEITLTVDQSAGSGVRLDRYCTMNNQELTRSRLKNGIQEVTVNGSVVKLSRIVRPGDRIVIHWEDPVPENIEGENIPLSIIYENDHVTVVNKRQGMVTHPAAGNWTGTLVNALLWHWKQLPDPGNLRAGIVHRLDKDTSGVIITARDRETESLLQKRFKQRAVRKTYIAILCGVPRPRKGIIETRIVRDPVNRKRFTCTDIPDKGKYAKTSYRIVRVLGNYSLCVFTLHTGRTHQIRVHARYLGTPILGDPVYGKKDKLFPDATLMLHARRLRIRIPDEKGIMTFTAPVPVRFRRVIRALTGGTAR